MRKKCRNLILNSEPIRIQNTTSSHKWGKTFSPTELMKTGIEYRQKRREPELWRILKMATGNTERNWWEARDMDSARDPDPQNPHVFGPPRSGSISRRYGSGSGSGCFLRLKIMCLLVSYMKKNMKKKNYFLHPQSHWRKELDPDPDPLVKSADPGIRIRTKMSRIPNTEYRDGENKN